MDQSGPFEATGQDKDDEILSGMIMCASWMRLAHMRLTGCFDMQRIFSAAVDAESNQKRSIDKRLRTEADQSAADGARVSSRSSVHEHGTEGNLKHVCLWLGMTNRAWEGWEKLHVKPHVAVCYYFSANAGVYASSIWIVIGSAKFRALYMYLCALPMLGFTVNGTLIVLFVWRHGPDVVHHKVYEFACLVCTVLSLPSCVLGYIGPIDAVPFHHRFFYICVSSIGMFATSHAMAAGGTSGEHPLQPRTSILRPFVRGTIRAAQLVDAFTDLAVITTLVEQACPHLLLMSNLYRCYCTCGLTALLVC